METDKMIENNRALISDEMKKYEERKNEAIRECKNNTDNALMILIAEFEPPECMWRYLNGKYPFKEDDGLFPEFRDKLDFFSKQCDNPFSFNFAVYMKNMIREKTETGKECKITSGQLRKIYDKAYNNLSFLICNVNGKAFNDDMTCVAEVIKTRYDDKDIDKKIDKLCDLLYDIDSSILTKDKKKAFKTQIVNEAKYGNIDSFDCKKEFGDDFDDEVKLMEKRYNLSELSAKGLICAANQISKRDDDIKRLTDSLDKLGEVIVLNAPRTGKVMDKDTGKDIFIHPFDGEGYEDASAYARQYLNVLCQITKDKFPAEWNFPELLYNGYFLDDKWQFQELVLSLEKDYIKEHVFDISDLREFKKHCVNQNIGCSFEYADSEKYALKIIMEQGTEKDLKDFMDDKRDNYYNSNYFKVEDVVWSDKNTHSLFVQLKKHGTDNIEFSRASLNFNIWHLNTFYDKSIPQPDKDRLIEAVIDGYFTDGNLDERTYIGEKVFSTMNKYFNSNILLSDKDKEKIENFLLKEISKENTKEDYRAFNRLADTEAFWNFAEKYLRSEEKEAPSKETEEER